MTTSHQGYIIRKAREDELSDIIAINRRNLPENYPFYFFKMHIERYPESFLVAEMGGQLAGYIMCRVETGELFVMPGVYGRKGHIVSIAVEPWARRRGIGTGLMSKAMDALKNVYGVKEYYLEVRVSNTPAINLYRKLGYSVIKVLKGYYLDGEDAYLMARPA